MKFKLVEEINKTIYYHVSANPIDKPVLTKEGIHIAKELDICKALVGNRGNEKYPTPYYYKITLKEKLNSVYFNDDYGRWDAKNIAQMWLDGVTDLSYTDIEYNLLNIYSRKKNRESTVNDFNQLVNCFKRRDYNSIEYLNTFESDTGEHSWILFSPDIIESCELIVDNELNEDLNSLNDKAKNEFGITNDFKEAGYILTDGSLLDLSGKNNGGPAHRRSLDHREIASIYDQEFNTATDYMIDFMNQGNIRIDYISASADIAKQPTEIQYKTLYSFIRKCIFDREDFNLDISNTNGNNIDNRYYEGKNANVSRIINDIKNYFSTGEFSAMNNLNNFR